MMKIGLGVLRKVDKKDIKNRFEYSILKFLSFIISKMSLKKARGLANMLAFIFYYFIPIRKNLVVKNLKIAFPDLDPKSLKKLTYYSYKNLFIVLIEILYLPYLTVDEIKSLTEISDFDLINKALSKNKGLIFVSAHFGNWEVLAISAALNIGKPFTIITKPLRNTIVNEYINNWRCRFGNKVVPLGISIKSIFKALLEKEIVAMVADQRASQNSIRMKFFSKETSVFEGPAVFSIKTGAPLILGLAIRQKDGKYKIKLDEIEIPESNDENRKIYIMTEKYIRLLEKYISQYPDQWLWFHNRWKH